ncbi:oligosaccharyl transferase, archaeosortase A system-associated [Halobium salinum]|uniref:dolichyl-phosphooligosaccharide-protein glycotransferase n=1 Tax=Halobium salinum TaxID=1364940 RepID=A0ABD5P6R5_9EURY|nr:oligosaccharyl transferase, archaeosortase A system-associated [Halobium salinum]
MSLRTESDGEVGYADRTLDYLERRPYVPVGLAMTAIMAVMLWIRLLPYDRFVRADGEVLFSGNDAWYHLREVSYTVRNWPSTIPFDPWTYFPYGTSTGQFGTLYDQLVATAALVVGLGSPNPELVAKTLLVAPAVFGALTAIPVYFLGKRLGGRAAGLFGAAILMLLPGTFLQRTLVGVSDHNGVEPFFQALAVLALVVAFAVAEREKPVWELVQAREVDSLRRPLLFAALAGVAVAMYMWVWPPGLLLIVITGIFLLLKMTSDVVGGDTPEPVGIVGAVAMTVTGLLLLVPIETLNPSPTRFSILQPLLAFAVAFGAVFLAALARFFEGRDTETTYYPAAVFGILFVLAGLLAVVTPEFFSLLLNNLLRIVGFSANAATRTIAEARPFLDPNRLQRFGNISRTEMIYREYGMAFFTAALAAIWLVIRPLVRDGETREYTYVGAGLATVLLIFLAPGLLSAIAGVVGGDPQVLGLAIVTALLVGAVVLARYDAEVLFVVVWAGFITAAAFTQVRFNYYLAVVVAVLNAFLLGELLRVLDLTGSVARARDNADALKAVAVVVVLVVALVPGMAVSLAASGSGGGGQGMQLTTPAHQTAKFHGPGAVTQWDGSLDWMSNNTPAVGEYGGADNAGELDYYGTYQEPADGNYDYPDGAYGVMSWWDYGHWITVEGDRIPNANPFQQGAVQAANYLLAPSESQAEDVLRSYENDAEGEGNQTRLVMVDWQMTTVGQKFGAPIVFYDAEENVGANDFYYPVLRQNQQGGASFGFWMHKQRYYDSQMVRLYQYHGSAMEPQPIVVDWETQTFQGQSYRVLPAGNGSQPVRTFDNMSAARAYVEQDGSAQVGGFGPYPEERVPALEHYRLVKSSESTAYDSRGFVNSLVGVQRSLGLPFQPQLFTQTTPSWVKTFERVPGATVEGSGAPANATVTATVQMNVPSSNSTFTYRQQTQADAQGNFEFTLPYSTTGYDQYGTEEGYTNTSVRATGPYFVASEPTVNESGYGVRYASNASVPEGQVVGAEDGPVTVELERDTRPPANAGNGSAGNASAGNATAGGAGNASTGNVTEAATNGSNASSLDGGAVTTGESSSAGTTGFVSVLTAGLAVLSTVWVV